MPLDQLTIPAGQLRHAVQVQRLSAERDAMGQPKDVWSTLLTTRAEIRSVKATEQFIPGQYTGQVTHLIRIRWPGILIQIGPGMRVLHGPHAYKIQTVENVLQRNRVLLLMTEENAASE